MGRAWSEMRISLGGEVMRVEEVDAIMDNYLGQVRNLIRNWL